MQFELPLAKSVELPSTKYHDSELPLQVTDQNYLEPTELNTTELLPVKGGGGGVL